MLSYLLFVARVRLIHTFSDLPDNASPRVAFGPRGEALISTRHPTLDDLSTWHLSLYRFQDTAGEKYNLTAETTGVRGRWKAVTDRNIYVQNKTNDLTCQLDGNDLSTRTTLHHEGLLRGCVHSGALVYGVERSERDWIINVHDPTGVVTLQPPSPRKWLAALSACQAGPYLVVTERVTRSLDVFTLTGNSHHFVSHAHDCYW